MPKAITDAVLAGRETTNAQSVADLIERRASAEEQSGFDIGPALDADLAMRECTPSPVTMDDLDRVIADPSLMPPGTEVRPKGPREYSLLAPGMQQPIRVTTDPAYYQPVVKVPRSRDRRDRSCVLHCLAWRWGQAAVERGKRRCGCPRRICRRVLGTRFTSD